MSAGVSPPFLEEAPSALIVGLEGLGIEAGGVVAGWARTMPPSATGEGWDSRTTSSSSVATSLAGITGSGASMEIPDKSSSGKADATCLRQSSKPVP